MPARLTGNGGRGGHPQNEVRKIQDILVPVGYFQLGGAPVLKLLRKIEKFRIMLVTVGYLGIGPVLKLLALTTPQPTCGETHIMDFFDPPYR